MGNHDDKHHHSNGLKKAIWKFIVSLMNRSAGCGVHFQLEGVGLNGSESVDAVDL